MGAKVPLVRNGFPLLARQNINREGCCPYFTSVKSIVINGGFTCTIVYVRNSRLEKTNIKMNFLVKKLNKMK